MKVPLRNAEAGILIGQKSMPVDAHCPLQRTPLPGEVVLLSMRWVSPDPFHRLSSCGVQYWTPSQNCLVRQPYRALAYHADRIPAV
jgi:hypothetical protein